MKGSFPNIVTCWTAPGFFDASIVVDGERPGDFGNGLHGDSTAGVGEAASVHAATARATNPTTTDR
jgi:hypothetical protein